MRYLGSRQCFLWIPCSLYNYLPGEGKKQNQTLLPITVESYRERSCTLGVTFLTPPSQQQSPTLPPHPTCGGDRQPKQHKFIKQGTKLLSKGQIMPLRNYWVNCMVVYFNCTFLAFEDYYGKQAEDHFKWVQTSEKVVKDTCSFHTQGRIWHTRVFA